MPRVSKAAFLQALRPSAAECLLNTGAGCLGSCHKTTNTKVLPQEPESGQSIAPEQAATAADDTDTDESCMPSCSVRAKDSLMTIAKVRHLDCFVSMECRGRAQQPRDLATKGREGGLNKENNGHGLSQART